MQSWLSWAKVAIAGLIVQRLEERWTRRLVLKISTPLFCSYLGTDKVDGKSWLAIETVTMTESFYSQSAFPTQIWGIFNIMFEKKTDEAQK